MKDDSLSDVTFCNTKEGMHQKAKELGIAAYNLGCGCLDCEVAFNKMLSEVGPAPINKATDKEVWAAGLIPGLINYSELEIKAWNAAIEAAVNKIEGAPLFANEIRKLNK